MREAIHRFNSLLFAWIPDVSGVPARRQVTIGIAASVLLHALILLIAVIVSGVLPERALEFAKSKPRLQEIELIVIPPEPEKEQPRLMELAANPERQFLDSRGLNESKDAPENASIESDVQMRAASELPATGSVPLPSQDGVNRPAPDFTTQKDTPGASPQPTPAVPAAPLSQPEPIPKAQEPAIEKPLTPAKETPRKPDVSELAALAQETMKKFRDVTKANDNEIALAAKPMVTPPEAVTRIAPIVQPAPVEMAKLSTPLPAPVRVPKSGYQPYQEKTKIEGSITNKGRNAVDAISTPLARYKKQVNDAIGSRWYHYVNQRMDLISAGSVRISFAIDERGKPNGITIDSNTANQSFADVCMRAVREAEIQPPPPDVIAPIKDGRLEYSLTFTFYNL